MDYKEIWDNQTMHWEPDLRNYYYYNSAGDTVSLIMQSWNSTWSTTMHSYSIFDNNHHRIFLYSFNQGTTDTTYREHFVYNGSGMLIADTNYKYNSGVPELYNRSEYYYSLTNKLDSHVVFEYDSLVWNTLKYWKYYRDVSDKDSLKYEINFNSFTSTYDSSYRFIYTYDTINFADTLKTDMYFGPPISWSWVYFEYSNSDSSGREIYHYWTCDACGHGTLTNHYRPTSDSLEYVISCYFNHGSGNPGCDSCIYLYQQIITGESEIEVSDRLIFPIPATNFLYINSGYYMGTIEADIYNIWGICVLKKSFSPTSYTISEIDISKIPIGTYIIRLEYADKTVLKKLTVIR